ncbi:ABC transporter permease [Desulfosarcina cetonica]|uniref:ABC transporter permease n=1 Tax=Desulfosarcina cetonica TaxID=90730 RepID=UPI001C48F94E|nr:hypothetical protein [Desulfosarcina cetonica]
MVYLIPLIGILVVWQGLSVWGGLPVYKLPPPIDIAKGLRDLAVIGMPPGRLLHNHVAWSLCRVFTGFVAAVVLAVPLGLVLGWSRRLQKMVWPLLEILRPIPPLAWIPISILWFGIGLKSAAFIIFLGIFFSQPHEHDFRSSRH